MTPWTCPRCLTLRREGGEVFAGTKHPCNTCWASMTAREKAPLVYQLRRRPIPKLAARDWLSSPPPHSYYLLAYIAHLEELLHPEGIVEIPEPTLPFDDPLMLTDLELQAQGG